MREFEYQVTSGYGDVEYMGPRFDVAYLVYQEAVERGDRYVSLAVNGRVEIETRR